MALSIAPIPILLLNTIIQNTIHNSATSKATNSSYDSGYNDYSNRTSCVRANSVPHYGLYCFIEPNTLCCNITN
jgi:hypothetical protein